MTHRWALPMGLVLVPLALTGVAVGLSVRTGVTNSMLTLLPSMTAIAVVGALLVGLRPRLAVGWLLLATGVPFLVGQIADQIAYIGLFAGTGASGMTALWVSNWIYPPALVPLYVLVPLTFPDGRLPSPRWRPLAALSVVLAAALGLSIAFGPATLVLGDGRWPNPYALTALAGLSPSVVTGVGLATLSCAIAAAASLIVRWRAAGSETRRQILWVVLALVVSGAGFGIDATLALLVPSVYPSVFPFLQLLPIVVPVSIAIAVLRNQLLDIDLLVNRAAVYLLLTALLVGAYVLATSWVGSVMPGPAGTVARLVATAVVAVAFAPLRDLIQRLVGRRLYGDRARPYAALTRLAQQLQAPSPPDQVLTTLVSSAAEALRAPYVALQLGKDGVLVPAVEHGHRPAGDADLVTVELTHGGEALGRLVVGQRGNETFSAADFRLMADLARPIGAAVQAVQLSVDLQRSRERMVLSMEEERRRVGRDLHDSLGPRLAAISMQVEAAVDLVVVNPEATQALLIDLLNQTESAVQETRHIAHTNRPPTLDALGLLPALQTHVAHLAAVPVKVDVPKQLPPLPAAVEIAAYRIALEAMNNVAAHAVAHSAVLRVTHDGHTLTLEVEDDGCGIPADHALGLGLQSMAERASELGGSLAIEGHGAGRGTTLRAVLPCAPLDLTSPIIDTGVGAAERTLDDQPERAHL